MGRSKNLHFVQKAIQILAPDDPSANWATGTIQVDKILSEELGRSIRNGNSYRLVGYGASLRGFDSASDLDIGFAGVATVQYCPVTKNGVGAWQSLQKQWMQQKRLASAVGKYVRYDDFEVAWDATHPLGAGRTSTILMSGLNDANAESVGIYGTSVDGTYVSLEDYYDSLNPIAEASKDPFGVVIKEPKFTDKFPDYRALEMPATFSASIETNFVPDALHGGNASGSMTWLPADNHMSHMTGTLRYFFKGVSYNRTTVPPTIPDELKLVITLVYEGWAPLAKVRSARGTKRIPSTASKGKSTTNARRRS